MKIYKEDNALKDCIRRFAFRNKYDIQSNDIVNKIFDRIKNNKMDEFEENNIYVKVDYQDYQKISHLTFENFYIDAFTDDSGIHINILLSQNFSNKDYQKLNFNLYEAIRHELEHLDNFIAGKTPDEKYIQLYRDLRNKHDIKEHVEMVAQYILSDVEIDSYIKSIMYIAKKQNTPVLEVIEQVIKRAFFGNDSEHMKEAFKDPEIKGIIERTRELLRNKLKEYYPKFKEKWL